MKKHQLSALLLILMILYSSHLFCMNKKPTITTVIFPFTLFFEIPRQSIIDKEIKYTTEDANESWLSSWSKKAYNMLVDRSAQLLSYQEEEVIRTLFNLLADKSKKNNCPPVYYKNLQFPPIYHALFTAKDKETAEKIYKKILKHIENAHDIGVSKFALKITAKYTIDEQALASVIKKNQKTFELVTSIKEKKTGVRLLVACNYPLYMWNVCPLKNDLIKLFGKNNILLSGGNHAVYPSQKLWKQLNINPTTCAVLDTEFKHLSLCTYQQKKMHTVSTQKELLQLLGIQKIKQ